MTPLADPSLPEAAASPGGAPPIDYRALVRRAIESRRQAPPRQARRSPLWSVVGQLLGVGSGTATQICADLGLNPDQMVKSMRG